MIWESRDLGLNSKSIFRISDACNDPFREQRERGGWRL